MSNKTIFTFIAVFGMVLAFNSNSNAQIRFSKQKPGGHSVDTRTQSRQTAHPPTGKKVNQAFIDQFNAIQRRKNSAAKAQKDQRRQQQLLGRNIDPRFVRGSIQQQGIGISQGQGQGSATFGSSAFGPAVVPPSNRPQAVAVSPRAPQPKVVTQRVLVVIKNPFFTSPDAGSVESQSVLKPLKAKNEAPAVESHKIQTLANPLYGLPAKHIPATIESETSLESPIEAPAPKSIMKSTGYSNSALEQIEGAVVPNMTETYSFPPPPSFDSSLQGLGPVYGKPVYENGVYFPGW